MSRNKNIICLNYLDGNCKLEESECSNIHFKQPFLWQAENAGKWQDLSEHHSIELEYSYCKGNSDGTKLSINCKSRGSYFNVSKHWFANFNKMCIKISDKIVNLRRLSTVSSVQSNHSRAASYFWYWLNKDGMWIKYDEASSFKSSLEIEKEFLRKSGVFEFHKGDDEYVIDFGDMVQVNSKTGEVNQIRRRPSNFSLMLDENVTLKRKTESLNASTVISNFEWEFQDNNDVWIKFDQGRTAAYRLSDLITAHFVGFPNEGLEIKTKRNRYELNFCKMIKINKRSGRTHRIRRVDILASTDEIETTKTNKIEKCSSTIATKHCTSNLHNKFIDLKVKQHEYGNGCSPNYEWCYEDAQKSWIIYGSPEDSIGIITSEDIERHYLNNPQMPLIVVFQKVKYVLNIQDMTETNTRTKNVREICRAIKAKKGKEDTPKFNKVGDTHNVKTLKYSKKETGSYKLNLEPAPLQFKTTNDKIVSVHGSDPTRSDVDNSNIDSTNLKSIEQQCVSKFEWYFQGDDNNWNKYGTSISHKNVVYTSSDEIERNYLRNPMKWMRIVCGSNEYVLNFLNMTQTNDQTMKVRSICRLPLGSSQYNSKSEISAVSKANISNVDKLKRKHSYDWYFLNEKNQWEKFGCRNKHSDSVSANFVTSEQIEKHYELYPHSQLDISVNSNLYTLDLSSYVQINKQTGTRRPIRRVVSNNHNLVRDGRNTPSVFEWFFFNGNNWVKYGEIGCSDDITYATTSSSDDIEEMFNRDPTQCVEIKSGRFTYSLDFNKMTQTNKETKVVRQICRIPTNSFNKNLKELSTSKSFMISRPATNEKKYIWYFEDEKNNWIEYGNISSGNDRACVTPLTSKDIEKAYQEKKTSMSIRSEKHTYILNFQNMTQVNSNTGVVRKIKRCTEAGSRMGNDSSAEKTEYEWFFLDENNTWIKYGQVNSKNNNKYVILARPCDIEKAYKENPHQTMLVQSRKHSYVINFKDMTQMNVKTQKVRQIKRVSAGSNLPITSKRYPSHWTPFKKISLLTVNISATESEFLNLQGLIGKTMMNVPIKKLIRIQNPFLLEAFTNRKSQLADKFPNVNYNEKSLFHGTSSQNFKSICEDNLDVLRVTRSALGAGIYFSNNATTSAGYSTGSPRCMFIVRVLVGKVVKGSPGIKILQNDCDTAVDNATNPSVFVKFYKEEYYPEYYVEF